MSSRSALNDAIDILHNYHKELKKDVLSQQKKLDELVMFLTTLRNELPIKLALSVDPGKIIYKAYRDVCPANKDAVREWNTSMEQLRNDFIANQKLRDENLLRTQRDSDLDEYVLPVRKIWERIASETKIRNLSDFVDSKLEPVYDSNLHFYNTQFFSSRQKSITSLYISRLLKHLKITDHSQLADVLRDQLSSTEESLHELILSKNKAESEYELSLIAHKYPSKERIQNSPRFKRLNDVRKELEEQWKREAEKCTTSAELLKDAVIECSNTLREWTECLKTAENDLNTKIARERSLSLQLQSLRALREISMNITHPNDEENVLDAWRRFVEDADSLIKHALSSGNFSALDSLVSDFEVMKSDAVYARTRIVDMNREKENMIHRLSMNQPIIDDAFPFQRVVEKRAQLENLFRRAFTDHLDKTREEQEWHAEALALLNGVSDLVSKRNWDARLDQLVESLGPELGVKLDELSALKQIRDSRIEKIEKIRAEIEQLRQQTSYVSHSNATSGRRAPGIDAKYTHARMMLACVVCDREGTIYENSCGHLLCDACAEKARKGRTPQCPYCHGNVSEFVTIKFSM